MGRMIVKVKDQIPGSTIEPKGPVMDFKGFLFLKTPDGGWITWFQRHESERLYDLCGALDVPYELAYDKKG